MQRAEEQDDNGSNSNFDEDSDEYEANKEQELTVAEPNEKEGLESEEPEK